MQKRAEIKCSRICVSSIPQFFVDVAWRIAFQEYNFYICERPPKVVKHEMARLGINVLGISETRWPGEDDYKSDGLGGGESQRGVAIILDKITANCVEKVRYAGDRLLMVRLTGKPVDMCIIQVYLPTTEHSEEEVKDMYEKIQQLLDDETKSKDYTVVMGDFNAVVGEGKVVQRGNWEVNLHSFVVKCEWQLCGVHH